MGIYRGLAPLRAYKGDMQPVNVYRGSTKVAGWHSASYSGQSPLTVDCDYDVPPDALTIDGRCSQVQSCWGTNLVTNGDFSNGTTGWYGNWTTISASGGKLDTMVTTSDAEHYSEQVISSSPVAGHKYYGRVYCEPVVGTACLQMYNRRSDGSYEVYFTSSMATAGISSGILTVSSVYSVPSFRFRLRLLNSAGSLNFKGTTEEARFSYACLIDLTAAFGAGKEPTAAQMDAIMAQFPNSWFDGSAQLSTDTTTYTPNSPSPSFPAPISTITGNATITGADGAASDTATVAFGSAVCASLPDGTHDSYDAVTGVLTKRVGKVVFDGTNAGFLDNNVVKTQVGIYRRAYWNFTIQSAVDESQSCYVNRFTWYPSSYSCYSECWDIEEPYLRLKILVSRLSADTFAAFKSWLAANPVTVYYKLATPTTIQLVPHLPVVRTGIKTLAVGADVVPTISATVKSMD